MSMVARRGGLTAFPLGLPLGLALDFPLLPGAAATSGPLHQCSPTPVAARAPERDPGGAAGSNESLSNLTPADVNFGRGSSILLERGQIKRQTPARRRLCHHAQA